MDSSDTQFTLSVSGLFCVKDMSDRNIRLHSPENWLHQLSNYFCSFDVFFPLATLASNALLRAGNPILRFYMVRTRAKLDVD